MRLTIKDIMHVNKRIRQRNNQARYNSVEEKKFTIAGTAGMFLMWNPYRLSEEMKEQVLGDEETEKPSPVINGKIGLPVEIGQIIGSYLNRNEAASVVQVCRNANNSACEAKENYIKGNGKSYEEEPYHPLPSFFF